MSNLESQMIEAVGQAVLKKLSDGSWMTFDYKNRIAVDVSFLRGVYEQIDMDRVAARLKDRLEDYIADKIFNAIATEVTTDAKRIMSNQELREDIRALLRQRIREAEAALSAREGEGS